MTVRLMIGDCRDRLCELPDESVQCVVTSPPYFGLRDYGVDGQLGAEPTPQEFVAALREVFREVWRVLRDDGVVWLNLGDSYAASGRGGGGGSFQDKDVGTKVSKKNSRRKPVAGFKEKDLIGIPWRSAFALQDDGWYLRQDIIWNKPNPMPESVRDRCTRAHEYLFMLTKSPRYYYDAEAIKESQTESTKKRLAQPTLDQQRGSTRQPGKTNGPMKAVGQRADKQRGHRRRHDGLNARWDSMTKAEQQALGRNKRSVWEVATRPYSGAHFATFPPELIEPCIRAGTAVGDTVLDPFAGSGTTGYVADYLQRDSVLVEMNPEYADLIRERLSYAGMFNPLEVA